MSFYVLEGIDFAGKTTILNELHRRRPEFIIAENPPTELRPIKDIIDHSCSDNARMCYYLLGSLCVSQLSSNSKVPFIADRYYYTTLVYEALRTGKAIGGISSKYSHILNVMNEPEKTIFLTVSEEKMRERLH